MCKSYGFYECQKCELSGHNNGKTASCGGFVEQYPEEAVAIVEKWSKENPLKTNRNKFLELFPYAPTYHNYPMDILPFHLGWCTESECMRCNHCSQPDAFCWDLPYEGDD
jgi:hypothetical protein